jgi:hypothetical protein
MYSQVDKEGHQFNILEALVDHRMGNDALHADDAYDTINGKSYPKRTTQGWQICVKWRDGTTSWEHLKDLKEANPIETAEYATSHSLSSLPAFSWWVPYTLKKRDCIISAVKARFIKKDFKFGIRVPSTIAEALRFDKENGDTVWYDSSRRK